MTAPIDDACLMFACLTASELKNGGMTIYQIALAERCCLRRVRRGVYVVTQICAEPAHLFVATIAEAGSTDLPRESKGMLKRGEDLRIMVRSYVDDLPPGAVFSHRSALIIHGLPVPYFSRNDAAYVEAAHPKFGVRRTSILIRKRDISDDDLVIANGIRTTSIMRTLFDISRDLPLAFAVAVVDEAVRQSLITVREFESYCASHRPRTNQSRIALVLGNIDPRRESVAESISSVRFIEYSIPGFEPQVVIRDEHGNFVARTDFANEHAGVIAEFDGAGKYYLNDADPKRAFELERRREYRLRNLGYVVFRLTWPQLFSAELFMRLKAAVEEGMRRRAIGEATSRQRSGRRP
ncbi:hypothetical protein SAMN04489751_2995 [Brevibacterium sandarakinum]|uniref:Transcriptional regulator, AbiEi antitoxin, Type IV TA system n=1 Tax=Brevibacterium sandarakinum TaxID=629680 RepID=A0A1H1VF53_BRESA|nr:hypothetical protein [Brevibacterium sandarakinum]SDS83424.1 hypothetical protein SAMN04489751_2995 [Brevibacterium sandarakinum]